MVTEGRFELGIGTGRPGIEDELRERGMPVTSPGERLTQVREAVSQLRELDGPELHTPVVMAVRGPRPRRWLARSPTPSLSRCGRPTPAKTSTTWPSALPSTRDVELALHVPVVGDGVAAFMASAREIDPPALHEADSMLSCPTTLEPPSRRSSDDATSWASPTS